MHKCSFIEKNPMPYDRGYIIFFIDITPASPFHYNQKKNKNENPAVRRKCTFREKVSLRKHVAFTPERERSPSPLKSVPPFERETSFLSVIRWSEDRSAVLCLIIKMRSACAIVCISILKLKSEDEVFWRWWVSER